MSRPFKVINCLSQGFAVAGPVEKSEAGGESVDMEMVVWGMSLERAAAMAGELNDEISGDNGGGPRLPLHLKD